MRFPIQGHTGVGDHVRPTARSQSLLQFYLRQNTFLNSDKGERYPLEKRYLLELTSSGFSSVDQTPSHFPYNGGCDVQVISALW